MQLEKSVEQQVEKKSPFKVGEVLTKTQVNIFDIKRPSVLGACDCACNCSSCFPAGTLVTMADGSTKKIEEVVPGEWIQGAWGELNQVLALDITTLGARYLFKINNEHSTTAEHPHIGAGGELFVGSFDQISSEWSDSKTYSVVTETGVQQWINRGVSLDRIKQLELGTQLQTVTGKKSVDSIEAYEMPPETPLYNFVVGGSHTYLVDGYAVTGWPREDDFNYDTWTYKEKSLTVDDYRASVTA
jgi:hypothetical protein